MKKNICCWDQSFYKFRLLDLFYIKIIIYSFPELVIFQTWKYQGFLDQSKHANEVIFVVSVQKHKDIVEFQTIICESNRYTYEKCVNTNHFLLGFYSLLHEILYRAFYVSNNFEEGYP